MDTTVHRLKKVRLDPFFLNGIGVSVPLKTERRDERMRALEIMAIQGIDSIVHVDGDQITARKAVAVGEEYFIDHFPDFAIVPGVLMLEFLVQAATWHLKSREGFTRSHVYLSHVGHVKCSKLVRPPADLELHCELLDVKNQGENRLKSLYEYQGKVKYQGNAAVATRFTLSYASLKDVEPLFSHLEHKINARQQNTYRKLVNTKVS